MILRHSSYFALFSLLLLINFLKVQTAYSAYEPYTLTPLAKYSGGKLKFDTTETPVKAYFYPSNFTVSNNFIYTWSGFERVASEGVSIGNVEVSDFFKVNDNLIVFKIYRSNLNLAIYDNNLNLIETKLIHDNINGLTYNFKYLGEIADKHLFLAGDMLFSLEQQNSEYSMVSIDSGIETAIIAEHYGFNILAYIKQSDAVSTLVISNEDFDILFSTVIDRFDLRKIDYVNNKLIISNSAPNLNSTFIQLFEPANNSFIHSQWLEAKINEICFDTDDSLIYAVSSQSELQNRKISINYLNSNKASSFIELPASIIEPMGLFRIDDSFLALYRNCIVSFNTDLEIASLDYFPVSEYFRQNIEVNSVDENHFLISSTGYSILFHKEKRPLATLNKYLFTTGRYAIPGILLLIAIGLLQLYRHQRRILSEIIEMQTSGVMLVLDKNGKMLYNNQSALDFLGITHKVKRKKPFQYYCRQPRAEMMQEIVEKVFSTGISINQKVSIIENNEPSEWFINVIVIRNVAGIFRGCVVTAFDVTEQFEKNRLHNWASLAHDMQTNLSTIKLNAENLNIDEKSSENKRKNAIIKQVNILIQRVRDLVTVGKSQQLSIELHSSLQICQDAHNEFDESMFPNVEFIVEGEDFLLRCDKAKITRGLRNAIENAIKALKSQPGKIIISSKKAGKSALFSVKDNGAGMDEVTTKKMMQPYFTSGGAGSGIGTMIMQHAAELHGGKVHVKSELNVGTEIIFEIPVNEKIK